MTCGEAHTQYPHRGRGRLWNERTGSCANRVEAAVPSGCMRNEAHSFGGKEVSLTHSRYSEWIWFLPGIGPKTLRAIERCEYSVG